MYRHDARGGYQLEDFLRIEPSVLLCSFFLKKKRYVHLRKFLRNTKRNIRKKRKNKKKNCTQCGKPFKIRISRQQECETVTE